MTLPKSRLHEAEEKFRLLVDSVKDYAIFIMDKDGYIQSWNSGAERIKGYKESEIVGKHFSIFYTQKDLDRNHPALELKVASEIGRYEEEGWRVHKSGKLIWANVVISAMKDTSGEVIGFAKVTRDLTEKKRAEDELRTLNANLEVRVRERTAELTDAIKIRDEFLSIASHELKTPITPLKLQIQGLVRLLNKNDFSKESVERIKQVSQTCATSIRRLGVLLDNLLDVSRINLGKLTLNIEQVNLKHLLTSIIERHQAETDLYGVELSYDLEDEIIGDFDHLRLDQVFTNLLINALKYGNKKPVHIGLSKTRGKAVVTVRDQGVGISEENKKRIFQRFERIENQVNVGGLGLGLYISHQIIAAHHGSIEVQSGLGTGTTFIVELPVRKV